MEDQVKIKLFISYSHKDKELCDELKTRLAPLKKSNLIDFWNDKEILAGHTWDEEIKRNLRESDIVIFLLSPDFLASQYIYDNEIEIAFDKHQKGEIVIVPVMLRICDIEDELFSGIQGLPKDLVPIDSNKWPSKDWYWHEVLQGLKIKINEVKKKKEQEHEYLEKEKQDRLKKERLAKEEQDKLDKERLEKEESDRIENERLEKEERIRLANERLQKEEYEKKEKERLENEVQIRLANKRLQKEEHEKKVKERLENEAQIRLTNGRLKKEKQDKLEKERLEKEEADRIENERLENEEKIRLENKRLEKEEQDRLEKERLEREKQVNRIVNDVNAKFEKDRLEKEKQERIKNETINKDYQANLNDGHTKLAKKDYDGAIAAFHIAAKLKPGETEPNAAIDNAIALREHEGEISQQLKQKPENRKPVKNYKPVIIVVSIAIVIGICIGVWPWHPSVSQDYTILPDTTPKKVVPITIVEPEMVDVQGGSFVMGSNRSESDKKLGHIVTLSGFKMGKYLVTQAEWRAVIMSDTALSDTQSNRVNHDLLVFQANPSIHNGCDSCPVENVSWMDVRRFIYQLNWLFHSKKYRLPTEAEWEYAAKGGDKHENNTFSGGEDIDSVGWYSGNSGNSSHPVGRKAPNGLGLYDMSGNVSEWCHDWFDVYSNEKQTDPKGPATTKDKVFRGGSWNDFAENCQTTTRNFLSPVNHTKTCGFRLASSL